ncbi:MAG: hypothetical protein KBG77_16510 [Dermatophilaceae bacterium]|nr:hypothetical protein [Dermatophilaceae bacterium]
MALPKRATDAGLAVLAGARRAGAATPGATSPQDRHLKAAKANQLVHGRTHHPDVELGGGTDLGARARPVGDGIEDRAHRRHRAHQINLPI